MSSGLFKEERQLLGSKDCPGSCHVILRLGMIGKHLLLITLDQEAMNLVNDR